MSVWRVVTLLAICVLATGCAETRMDDLRDCSKFGIGYGLGLGVEASLGGIGNPSLGVMATTGKWGTESRDVAGFWMDEESFWPFSSWMLAMMESTWATSQPKRYFAPYGRGMNESLRSPSWLEIRRMRTALLASGKHDRPQAAWTKVVTDFEVGGVLLIPTVRVGLNPLEIVDFALGYAGVDFMDDDVKKTRLRIGPNDAFVIRESDVWDIRIEKYEPMHYAEIKVTPKMGPEFILAARFVCDTPDMGNFDTTEKLKKTVELAAEPYLDRSVEEKIELRDYWHNGSTMWTATVVDKAYVGRRTLVAGEFRCITLGIVRLSRDSVLEFTLMEKEISTSGMESYVLSFVRGPT